MALYFKNKTRLSLTIAKATESEGCSGNTNQDVKIVGVTDVSWNADNIFQEHGSSASHLVNVYFNDSDFNSSGIYQKKNWELNSATTFGDGNFKTAKNFGCYYYATCGGGTSNLVERLIPNIDVTLVSQIGNAVTLELSFPAYINGLSGITGTFTNQTRGTTLGTISAVEGNSITIVENINIGDIHEYMVEFAIEGQDNAFATCWIEYGSTLSPTPVTNINVPSNSFYTFGGDDSICVNDCFCLPIVNQQDVSFQVNIDAIDYNIATDTLLASLQSNEETLFYVTPCVDCGSVPAPLTATADLPYTITWSRLSEYSSVLVGVVSTNNDTYFNSLATNTEMRLCFVRRDYSNYPTEWDDTYLGCSNFCFKKSYGDCFKSLISYSNNEDNFCFYAIGIDETIRLPLHLKAMQIERKTKGYQKSNGDMVKLADRINESYTMKIDYMPKQAHKKLAIALSSDNVSIQDYISNTIGDYIHSQEDYKINWSENDNISLANAETKVYLQSNPCSINSNC